MKHPLLFAGMYIVISTTEIAADLCGIYWLVYLTKPLIVISLLVYAMYTKNEREVSTRKYFIAALFFALLGDVFLMVKEADLFIPGLASFLVMQILYAVRFKSDIRKRVFSTSSLLRKIPFLAFATLLYLILLPNLPDLVMKIAVAVYAYSIATMAWLAFLRKGYVSTSSYNMVFVGSLLFMISDSLIAISRFLISIPFNTIWVMTTYAAAQFLIVMGSLKTKQASV